MRREKIRYGWNKAKRMKVCYLFLLPYALLFFTFIILPICTSIFYSFTYYNILEPARFIGFQNYVNLFLQDEVFLTAHVGAVGTTQAVKYAREAAALGYDAIAATPPFYYAFGSREVYGYYADIAQAAGMPVLIYNFPGNTNRPFDLSDPVTQKLFTSDFILGVKHTNQVVYQLERIRALNPRLTVMNGFDETMVAGLALGADGSIGSTFNFMFPHYRRIYDLFRAGQLDEARALQVRANNIMAALCAVGLIPAIKWVLADMGVPVGEPRRPFMPITAAQGERLRAVLEANCDYSVYDRIVTSDGGASSPAEATPSRFA
jgi:N-acetylneuraminate lyase